MADENNNVILQGEICWPEMKYTKNGKALFKSKVRIPTTDQRTGESRESYLRITAWEDFAEYLNTLPQGSRIRVSGRIQERSFTNREGKRQNVTDIVVNGVEPVDSEEGENFFLLSGTLQWPELRHVGERGTPLFKAKVKVPFYREDDPSTLRHSYVRITAWDDLAESLSQVGPEGAVKVTGHIQDRKWTDPRTEQKRVFTDAVVTNFTAGTSAGV
ncbi:MAG: single-stranded DNA-binding protein [Candidatus Altiarchaeales archaeon]|nr:single-stranded DNA-binding protein [Candidatus Altiarchaeales archaeon]